MEERRRSDKGVTHKGARGRWHNRGRLTDNGLGAFMLEHRDLTTHLPLRDYFLLPTHQTDLVKAAKSRVRRRKK